MQESVDVLIVGSGPAGCTYARVIGDALPDAVILVVEVGPATHEIPGLHTRDMPADERAACELASQGPDRGVERGGNIMTFLAGTTTNTDTSCPAGLFLLGSGACVADEDGMPAAAMSSGVGGMGVHWTGSCPRPTSSERIDLVPPSDLDAAYDRAEELLLVSKNNGAGDPLLERLRELCADEFDRDAPDGPQVGFMPISSSLVDGVKRTGGPWSILGDLGERVPGFEIRPDTLAKRVIVENGTAVGVELHNRISGDTYVVGAKRVVVCADSLRTPQLLFASGVRSNALGHYLNDHFQLPAFISLADEFVADDPGSGVGTVRIPFVDGVRPMQGQVVHFGRLGDSIELDDNAREFTKGMGLLAFYGAKDLRYDDCVEFSDDNVDFYGMPAMTVHYNRTEADRHTIELMRESINRTVKLVGSLLSEPVLAPFGSSLHYQGTVRMGAADDGHSVCDLYSRVWGIDHLQVGGNGVIPTSTAANPTLTHVALAVIGAGQLVSELRSS